MSVSHNKPFEAGYAKSSRSTCKGCMRTILQGVVRLAVVRQSFQFDGKMVSWFHEECFWNKHRPKTIADIENINSLKKTDQDRIAQKIQGSCDIPEVEAAPKKGRKGKKGKQPKVPPPTFAVNDFTVQYSKSNRAQCGGCPAKIAKDEVRVAKKEYESDKARMFGGLDQWYHLGCFVQLRKNLEFLECGSHLPGFNQLSKADQQLVTASLPSLNDQDDGPGPSKKPKVNKSKAVDTTDEARVVLDDISNDTSSVSVRSASQPKVPVASTSSVIDLTSDTPQVIRFLPLKDMTFFIHSSEYNKDIRQDLTRQITLLGGRVVSKINPNVTAVIATARGMDNFLENEEGTKANSIMEQIRDMEIHVVPRKFVKECATTNDAIGKILSLNIAFWGSDDRYDIEQRMKKHQEEEVLKSSSKSILKSQKVGSKVKIQIQDGVAVDPESGLQDTCEVAKRDKKPLNAVFSLANVTTGKNSYYKLQVLKSKISKSKFYLFRSWGRIGTTIGGTKVEEFKSLNTAFDAFDKLFQKESGNTFDEPFVAQPGKMILMDVNYDASDSSEDQVDGPSSQDTSEDYGDLHEKVVELIKFIFNQERMKSVLREFELDIEKMPLGKLSVSQIKQGYTVLEKVLEEINKNSKANEDQILAFTNAFYTLIPHSFGLKNPPMLDSEDIVKNKLDLLETMLQIDQAFNMTKGIFTNRVLSHYSSLQADIKPIDASHEHFDIIMQYVLNTHAQTHRQYNLKIKNMFELTRQGESKRFKPFEKMENKSLLWHGSRQTNFAGIISKGLCIAPPEAPVTGYMFGKGIYFADSVSKSANYCMTTSTNNLGLLLLCEVALGTMYERTKAESITKLPSGYHSVKGVGRNQPDPTKSTTILNNVKVPLGELKPTTTSGSLLYNEYVVYDPAQVKIRYLLLTEFDYNDAN